MKKMTDVVAASRHYDIRTRNELLVNVTLKCFNVFVDYLLKLNLRGVFMFQIHTVPHIHNWKLLRQHLPFITHLILVCPPRSHTWNFRFLYVTVSTLKPIAAERKKKIQIGA